MACECFYINIVTDSPNNYWLVEQLSSDTPTGTFGNGQPYWIWFNAESSTYFELSQDSGIGVWKVRVSSTPIITPNIADELFESSFSGNCPSNIKFDSELTPTGVATWFISEDGFSDVNIDISGSATTWPCWNCATYGFYVWFTIKEISGEIGAAQIDGPTGTFDNDSPYYQFELISINTNLPAGYYFQLSRGTNGTGNWQLFRINSLGVDPTTPTDLLGTYTGSLPDENCAIGFNGKDWVDENGSLDFGTEPGVVNFSKPNPVPTTTTTTTKSIVTITPRNECDVLTIFPMNAICQTLNPSTPESFDGSALLYITGGTPPYTVQWDSGNVGQFISDLNIGEYSATITDFYNDFTIRTTCVLTAHTPTTTTTTTTTPIPVYDPLCMEYVERRELVEGCKECGTTLVRVQIQFYPHIEINGEPSWTGNTDYLLYWDPIEMYWEVTGSTITGDLLSDNPTTPPLLGWGFKGNPNWDQKQPIVVTEGLCDTSENIPIIKNIVTDEESCKVGGKITIYGQYGTPPYMYSIDGGNTYSTQSIFTNLLAGTYYVVIKDSLNNTSTVETVVITQAPVTTYSLTLTRNTQNKTFQITTSAPPTETILFTLNQISTLKYWPDGVVPTPTHDDLVTFTAGATGGMNLSATTNSQDNISCGGNTIIRNTQTKVYTKPLTISGGQIITGTYNDTVINPPTKACQGRCSSNCLEIAPNPRTTICGECCEIDVINPGCATACISNPNFAVGIAIALPVFTTTTTTAAP